jgi:H+/Cl- antiporter ClcA
MQPVADGRWRMPLATVLVGLLAGIGGVGMSLVLHAVQHLAFGYTENTFLVGVEEASSPRRVLAVTAGGIAVGAGWWWFRRRVPAASVSVTRALREPFGRLPVMATTADALLQVVAVGVGASLGREGAPRQTAAALGGWAARRCGVTVQQYRTLLACGAGAGLAAAYNVPAGGALFALEVLLVSLTLRDVIAAAVTSAIATVVAWPVLGDLPAYPVPALHYSNASLLAALLLGPVSGVAAVGFVRLTGLARTHAAGGARAAVAIPVVFAALGAAAIAYPQVLGNGKGPAQLAFAGTMGLGLAGALVLLKPLATAACLRAGAVGGLLTPALATGAVLGMLVAQVWIRWWPGPAPAGFALIGAAAMLAVTQRAPATAIVLCLEFLHTGQALIAPIVVAVALAVVCARLIDPDLAPFALGAIRRQRRPRPGSVRRHTHSLLTVPAAAGRACNGKADRMTSAPLELIREMFAQMVERKDASLVDTFYDPDFLLYTNGQVQDLAAFRAGHEAVYPTAITYRVEYDDEAWVEAPDRLAGRVWITTQRPGEQPHRIEVMLIATFRAGRIHRLWELTWPDWSQLAAFERYGGEATGPNP